MLFRSRPHTADLQPRCWMNARLKDHPPIGVIATYIREVRAFPTHARRFLAASILGGVNAGVSSILLPLFLFASGTGEAELGRLRGALATVEDKHERSGRRGIVARRDVEAIGAGCPLMCDRARLRAGRRRHAHRAFGRAGGGAQDQQRENEDGDRKSTRLNSSHT